MIKLPLLALFGLLACAVLAFSQPPETTWTHAYGGTETEAADAVVQTTDGGFLLAGYSDTPPAQNFDIYLVRITGDGDTLWTKRIGGDGNDQGRGVRQTADGGFVLVAMTSSFGRSDGDVWLLKLTATGDTVWTRFFGGTGYDDPAEIKVMPDGGFLIAGYGATLATAGDGYLIRTNSAGDTLWTRHYGGVGEQGFYSVEPLSDGGLIMAGYATPSGTDGMDMYVVRTNAQGDTLWTRRIGSQSQDQAVGAQPMADGGFMIGGFTQGTVSGQADYQAISLSSAGATRWTHTYGGVDWDRAFVLRRATDGNFVLGGITHSYGAGNHDFWMVKFNSAGDTLWTKVNGGAGNDYLWGMEVTHDGGYIEVGFTNSYGNGGSDCFAVRLPGFSGVGGIIRDESTGLPLANVWVSAVGQSQSALSDAAGQYVLILPPDTTFDVITYGPCTERDTVRNVAVIEDSVVAVDFMVARNVGVVPQSSINIVAQNHETGTDSLLIVNEGAGVLDFNVAVQTIDPASAWLAVDPVRGSVAPGDTFHVAVLVEPDTTDDGVYDYFGRLNVLINSCPDSAYLVNVIATVMDAGDKGLALPTSFQLSAYPNPFNPTTTIEFALPHNERVELNVYDVTGRLAQTILNEIVPAGVHRVEFDAANLPSGLYFARLTTSKTTLTRKLLLLK